MTNHHRATTISQWPTKARAVDDDDSSCILELRARVEALEELHKAVADLSKRFSLDPLVDRVDALEGRYETQRQATLAWGKEVDQHSRWIEDHLKRIMALEAGQKTPPPAVDRVRDLQDQIRDGSLTLAEALKEIDGAPDPTVRTMLPSGLPATSDPITRRLWQPLRTEITYGEANAHAQDLVRHLSMDHLNYPEIPDSSPAPTDSLVERVCVEAGIHNPADARAAIREVAAALIDWHDSDHVVRTAWEAAKWLEREAIP